MSPITQQIFKVQENRISENCIIITDEMYLLKGTQYQGGEYVGAYEERQLHNVITVLMIVS